MNKARQFSKDISFSMNTLSGGIAVELKAGSITSGSGSTGTTNYSYDANGNIVSDGLKLFEYNEANQLKTVKLASNSATLAEYTYDYTGKRMIQENVDNFG